MNRNELERKLDIAFAKNLNLGVDVNSGFKDEIGMFKKKIILLSNTGRYNKLIKSLISSKDKIEFNSYVFETYFAYDFESKGRPLKYEIKLLKNSGDTVDFLYNTTKEKRICFDLHQANQRKWLTAYTKAQLDSYGMYEITLGGQDEQDKIIRLQNLILSKCQDKSGKPRKFIHDVDIHNVIVIYVSGEIDGHIDKFDCMLTMYGDSKVPFWAQRNVFGLCQQLSDDHPEQFRPYYEKFKHFRETIYGVLFVKNPSRLKRCYGDLILDLDLEYYLVGNNNLVDKDNFREICAELHEVLNSWAKKKDH